MRFQEPFEAKSAKNPVDFFLLFFDENRVSRTVQQPNRYGQQQYKELEFAKYEFFVLVDGIFLSGYGKYSNKSLF